MENIISWFATQPISVKFFLCFTVYALASALPAPTVVPMSLLCGWILGVISGSICVSLASVTGASLTFLFARKMRIKYLSESMQKRISPINSSVERRWFQYLVALRLVPGIPFFLLNFTLGLSNVSLKKFWMASQIGMLPASILIVSAGAQFPSIEHLLENPRIAMDTHTLSAFLCAAAAIILLPSIMRFLRYLVGADYQRNENWNA